MWLTSEEVIQMFNYGVAFFEFRFHEDFDLILLESMATYELIKNTTVILYSMEVAVHLFVLFLRTLY